jgi:hypothetical protein
MAQVQETLRHKIQCWCDSHKHAVLYDDEKSTLLDVSSLKTLRIPWAGLKAFEAKVHPETKDVYLALLFENGAQLALVDPGGVAFAPSTVSSGPVENLPAVVCLGDFLTLKQRVDHYLLAHADELPPRECVHLIMFCIAILDGARAVGFEVGDYERELEAALDEIERKKG